MSNSRIVYSTDNNVVDKSEVSESGNINPSEQVVRIHLDRKGGGRIVTIIRGLMHESRTMIDLTKELKKKCGSGGSFKNNEILIQGNKRDVVQEFLRKKGYNPKFSGG